MGEKMQVAQIEEAQTEKAQTEKYSGTTDKYDGKTDKYNGTIGRNRNHFVGRAVEYDNATSKELRFRIFEELCELAGIQPGDLVLDMPSGSGRFTVKTIAQRAYKGKVIGVDSAPDMVSLSQRLAAESGAYNVRFVVGSAEQLPLPDNSVDVAISGYGFQWFYHNGTDKRESVARELYKVIRPGGRVGIAAAGTGSFSAIIDAINAIALREEFKKYFREEGKGEYLLGFVPQTEESLEKILLSAGFVHVRFGERMTEKAESDALHPNLDAYLRKIRAIAREKNYFERIASEDRRLAAQIEKELSGKELIEEDVVLTIAEVPKNKKSDFKYSPCNR